MDKKGKIIRVVCPHCGLEMREKLRAVTGETLFNSYKKIASKYWECKDCVYIFGYGWFDTFFQYERFILREKEDKELWELRLRIDGETVEEWVKRMETENYAS